MCFTKYYKNFILRGEADYHCLLCEETFHKSDDIEKHIRWEKHRKILKLQNGFPKFKNDGIYKIGSYYYCQFCNHVAYNMASIKGHINLEKHTTNKANPEEICKRIEANYDSGVVTIQKLKINPMEWHGIQNKSCLICNVTASNISKHIESQDHIIRLIQTEAKYEGDDKCYRKINEITFQCFICMKPFSDLDKHWEEHDKNPIEFDKVNGDSNTKIRIFDRTEYFKLGDQEFDMAKLVNVKDEFYNIDLTNKEITCKQCNLAVRNTVNDLSNHMYKKHHNFNCSKSNIIELIREDIEKDYIFIHESDAGKKRHEMSIYGKGNHIKLNAGGSKGYCTLCDRFLSAHINIFKQHVGGSVHKNYLEMKGLAKVKKHKKAMLRTELFIHCLENLDYITEFDGVAVNEAFCIDPDSFLLMKRIEHGQHFKISKCFVCDETFEWWKEKEHCEKEKHKFHFMAAKVVFDKNNLIREIKPKLYHCGFCNVTLPYWETLEKHITNMSHKTKTMEKFYQYLMTRYEEQNGTLPEVTKISLSPQNDVLYANILKVLFGSKLGNLKIYTIDFEKLQESKSKIIILA